MNYQRPNTPRTAELSPCTLRWLLEELLNDGPNNFTEPDGHPSTLAALDMKCRTSSREKVARTRAT